MKTSAKIIIPDLKLAAITGIHLHSSHVGTTGWHIHASQGRIHAHVVHSGHHSVSAHVAHANTAHGIHMIHPHVEHRRVDATIGHGGIHAHVGHHGDAEAHGHPLLVRGEDGGIDISGWMLLLGIGWGRADGLLLGRRRLLLGVKGMLKLVHKCNIVVLWMEEIKVRCGRKGRRGEPRLGGNDTRRGTSDDEMVEYGASGCGRGGVGRGGRRDGREASGNDNIGRCG